MYALRFFLAVRNVEQQNVEIQIVCKLENVESLSNLTYLLGYNICGEHLTPRGTDPARRLPEGVK
jgi:hypothetical protein